MLQLKLPAAHFVRVPAGKRRGLARSLLLRRAAIFGQEEDYSLQDRSRAGCPCGEGGDRREKPKSKRNTCMERKVIKITNFIEWEGGTLVWDHQVEGCGFSGRGFDTRVCFPLRLPSSRLRGYCGFGLRCLRSGSLSCGGHFRLLESVVPTG